MSESLKHFIWKNIIGRKLRSFHGCDLPMPSSINENAEFSVFRRFFYESSNISKIAFWPDFGQKTKTMEFCVFDLPVIYDQKREIPLDLLFYRFFSSFFAKTQKHDRCVLIEFRPLKRNSLDFAFSNCLFAV